MEDMRAALNAKGLENTKQEVETSCNAHCPHGTMPYHAVCLNVQLLERLPFNFCFYQYNSVNSVTFLLDFTDDINRLIAKAIQQLSQGIKHFL